MKTTVGMKTTVIALAALLAGVLASAATGAQPASTGSDARADAPKVYHAGGKHDRRAHEAALKARTDGRKVARPAVHPGGRHDAQLHEAAIRADEKRRPARD